jgi:ferrous iron transport protein A
MTRLPLLDVSDGLVRVAAFACDAAKERHLSDLGLHVGAQTEIVQHNGENGLVVAVKGQGRVVLDRDTARAVLVTRLEPVLPPLTIAAMKPGERARIVGLGRGDLDYRQRLMSMGLTPGIEFEITRVAPLGDPVEIKVRGFSMSLRKAEAQLLTVEKLP